MYYRRGFDQFTVLFFLYKFIMLTFNILAIVFLCVIFGREYIFFSGRFFQSLLNNKPESNIFPTDVVCQASYLVQASVILINDISRLAIIPKMHFGSIFDWLEYIYAFSSKDTKKHCRFSMLSGYKYFQYFHFCDTKHFAMGGCNYITHKHLYLVLQNLNDRQKTLYRRVHVWSSSQI